MKNTYYFKFLLLTFISLFLIKCTNDGEEITPIDEEIGNPIEVDLKVSTLENPIYFEDTQNLSEELNRLITFEFSGALEEDTQRVLEVNSDSTKVRAQINFKQEAVGKYYDPTLNNNFIEIDLVNIRTISSEDTPAASATFCDMLDTLNNELNAFDFNSFTPKCIPVVFHISKVYESEFTNSDVLTSMLNIVNQNFQVAKLSFLEVGVMFHEGIDYFNIDVINTNFEFDVPGKLNIYISNAITYEGSYNQGFGTWPNQGPDRLFVLKKYIDPNNDPEATILCHEIGHNFSLHHTFTQNSCPGQMNNDIPTTPLDVWYSENHNEYGETCFPNNPEKELIIRNYMSYSLANSSLRQNCDYSFVLLQRERMAFAHQKWKNYLVCGTSGTGIINLSGDLNFGNQNINTSTSRPLTVSNDGNLQFAITDITVPQGFSINGSSQVVDPGESFIYQVTFSPTEIANYSGEIVFETNGANGDNTIDVSGNGVSSTGSQISLSGNLNFGSAEIGQSIQRNLTISNSGDESFQVNSINFPYSVFSSNFSPGNLNSGQSMTVQITFTPVSIQSYNGVLTVSSTADSGNNTTNIIANGVDNGSSFSEISISGNTSFGDVEINTSEQRVLTISNLGTESFHVSSIDLPYSVYSANWNSGTVSQGSSQNVTVTFSPLSVQNYDGPFVVNSDADQGNNTATLSGNGVTTDPGYSDLIVQSIIVDDEGAGVYDIDTVIENIGQADTPVGEDIFIDYYIDGQLEGSDTINFIAAGDDNSEFLNNYSFSFQGLHTIEVVIQPVSNEINISNNTSQITYDNSGSGGQTITPSNSCSTAPIMNVNTVYSVSIDVGNYTLGTPIDGESFGGNNIRGFWLGFQVPSGWSANHDVKITNVSSNFDPVIGLRANCSGPYLGNGSQGQNLYINDNGNGGNETSDTNLPGSNNGGTPDDIYYVRIYHFYGNETPNITFDIIVE